MELWVVLRKTLNILGENINEFKRPFSSMEAAESYIESGKNAGIESAEEEFVEFHTIRDS